MVGGMRINPPLEGPVGRQEPMADRASLDVPDRRQGVMARDEAKEGRRSPLMSLVAHRWERRGWGWWVSQKGWAPVREKGAGEVRWAKE
jgi:hypothetical protein